MSKLNDGLKCRYIGANRTLSVIDPAYQYQNQKVIWNTVRVPATLYMHDLGALTVYQTPGLRGVNWNQMSDRRERHVQPSLVGGGSFYHTSSTKHTITRLRPGAGSPGGAGVDIKHNSYDRYLRRLVGKGPVRRGIIPPNYGMPFIFNPATPIYGNKTIKTSIVGSNCNCPIITDNIEPRDSNSNNIYKILVGPLFFNNQLIFKIGENVYALNAAGYYEHAVIIEIVDHVYTVLFDDGKTIETANDKLLVYFACNCSSVIAPDISVIGAVGAFGNELTSCYIINKYLGANNQINTINYIKDLLPPQFQTFLNTYYPENTFSI